MLVSELVYRPLEHSTMEQIHAFITNASILNKCSELIILTTFETPIFLQHLLPDKATAS